MRKLKGAIFKGFCKASFWLCVAFLLLFLGTLIKNGVGEFSKFYIKTEFVVTENLLANPYSFESEYKKFISRAWIRELPALLRLQNAKAGDRIQTLATANADVQSQLKLGVSKLNETQISQVANLRNKGVIINKFSLDFFTKSDSKIPENAGFLSAIFGSVLVMCVAMMSAFPVGLASGIYLEKFAKDNKFSKFIEISINNLNAVPSIIFGLLGLAVFINFFGLPRSSIIVGGLVLGIMSLPVIIVSVRSALRSVPESISQAGYSLGLNKFQVIKDHVLPSAWSGILTGIIMALAGAIGETAPLMIVGMIAFVPEMATSLFSPSAVMPSQIFIWSGSPELIYVQKTSAAILTLLFITFSLNLLAIILRNKINKKAQ
ncbi:phosphate ABC transporter permease PstA [Campylobacter suis]|uniref:Phosphate transport system permease protein PstA n=1 Tax=Campylobacter suis TaxID=2790657 RepID=A0ABN7K5X8_9BACT|nr:phosphate ABC transporter permease PstA [Campylobacter suis]CAD7287913.1 hypothetical protein LMG8286_01003 [Campylobacter suis]